MTRDQLLEHLADLLAARRPPHPLRVAVDGVDAAGKTTLADELARAQARDAALFGSAAAVQARYATRYIPGQQIYLRAVRPDAQAEMLVDNDDPQQPQLRVRAGFAGNVGSGAQEQGCA